MTSGAGIIKERFLELADSLNGTARRWFTRMAGKNGHLLESLDGETRELLSEFAERNRMTPEEAAIGWLGMQAKAYQQDKQVEQLWGMLTDREQQVVALCCLEYSDQEIADMLHIAYGTARTHLYNAIYKLGIHRKPELLFLLRNWDFSKFDREYPYG
ncbi:MAG TPA: LuxR C-terminal-related transcriptional regulator [Anaerolineales bacterium]|jgi:DNA-binding CsgD family transcriptional regulator|nr:LuxR C-terminal-related transcriptional regulator [Anaerolineales bacterium]